MASQQSSGSVSFSLFPKPQSRGRSVPVPVSQQHQGRRAPTLQDSPPSLPPVPASSHPRNGRQMPQQSTPFLQFDAPRQDDHMQHSANDNQPSMGYGPVPVQQLRLIIDAPGQAENDFSKPQNLAHGNTNHHSRSSVAKLPLDNGPSPSEQQQQALQSIFPTFNPDLPLEQQNYAPNQMGPSQIPKAIISRQSYYESPGNGQERPFVRHPGRGVPSRPHNPPIIPETCTSDQLRDLWKVTSGWRASGSEGRIYCLKLSQQKDAPVYTLSSASQPFYNLRLDPTSASAYVSLTRYDPSKAYKASRSASHTSTSSILSGGGLGSESKYWQEALSTTLEEESRKHRPNDGLVALLMPSPATKIAVEKAEDPLSVAAAERECARLVWDDDSSSHFLVHPALATPFCVTVENCPAWSRVEYTLEHHESPHHLAKLTRDGTGGGWLEINTKIASKIEAFYIVDVAVAALLLVAAVDDRGSPAVEAFEVPPAQEPPKQARSLSSALSRHREDDEGRKVSKAKEKKRPRMEQSEIDIESQNEGLSKNNKKAAAEDKLSFAIRAMVKVAKGIFNCLIWLLTVLFTCFKGVFKVFYKCVGSKY